MNTALPLETHPLGFFLPQGTKLLMLGSFPPPKPRRSMDFYYPNFQNDMRRILGLIFHHDKNFFIAPNGKQFDEEKAKKFCEENSIGIGDTAEQIIRLQGNAADDKLQVIKPANIEKTLEGIPECHTLVITGQKAMETLRSLIDFPEPKIWTFSSSEIIGRVIRIYRMPSTSRAYPKPLAEKAKVYETMFREISIIKNSKKSWFENKIS